jgi:hypothetical protein
MYFWVFNWWLFSRTLFVYICFFCHRDHEDSHQSNLQFSSFFDMVQVCFYLWDLVHLIQKTVQFNWCRWIVIKGQPIFVKYFPFHFLKNIVSTTYLNSDYMYSSINSTSTYKNIDIVLSKVIIGVWTLIPLLFVYIKKLSASMYMTHWWPLDQDYKVLKLKQIKLFWNYNIEFEIRNF